MLPMQFNEKQASHFERLVFIICFAKAKCLYFGIAATIRRLA